MSEPLPAALPPSTPDADRRAAPRPPSAARLAWTQLQRDFRAGELRLLAVAVVLAVAALTAVAFFASRIQAGLERDARQLLGGDAVVASDQPPPPVLTQRAQSLGLRTATSATFPSMARASDEKGGATRLVAVKAVSEAYPLRGRLQLQEAPGGPVRSEAAAPPRGQAWVDAPVLDALGLRVGDALLLGDATLTVSRVIAIEPDRGAGFVAFAPRVMIALADLEATALIQPASRVTWRLAVAAPPGREAAVRLFVEQTEAEIKRVPWRGVRVESLETGRPEMRQTLDRAGKFLNLVALLAALLAAVAVALAARQFAQAHLDTSAMLRVLGLPQRRIAWAYTLEFAAVGVLGSAAGVALGYAVHGVFVRLLAGLVEAGLPAPGAAPVALGMGVGMTLLLAFGLPPVLQLARVPPLRVLRRDVGGLKAASWAVLALGTAGFAALLVAVAADVKMGLIAVAGFAAAVAVFALLAWGAVALLRVAVVGKAGEAVAPRWLLLAARQLASRTPFAVLQISALAVGLLALTLLVLLRTDLIASWKRAAPADAPNRFVINIQPEQEAAFRQALQAAGVSGYDWYPMVRGRLTAINGREVRAQDFAAERAQRLVEREFNLSHAAQRPPHNPVVAGQWRNDEADALSVEQGLAQTLGLKLGDRLAFDIAGQTREGRITSLRQVEWGSMRANFFVMFPLAAMPGVPATYLAAFRAPAQPGFDNALSREFPNITSVDITASVAQVQRVLDQVIAAVEFLFAFTLAAGLLVLLATVAATREERAREFALMRAFGARQALLRAVQRAELLGVGALAGLMAALAAMAVGWVLAKNAFDFDWSPAPWVPLAGAAVGAALALAAGWWGLRGVLRRPVVQTLRQAAD